MLRLTPVSAPLPVARTASLTVGGLTPGTLYAYLVKVAGRGLVRAVGGSRRAVGALPPPPDHAVPAVTVSSPDLDDKLRAPEADTFAIQHDGKFWCRAEWTSPPAELTRYAGYEFRMVQWTATWQEHRLFAATLGADLVSIADAAENDWIYNTFSVGTSGKHDSHFFGLTVAAHALARASTCSASP